MSGLLCELVRRWVDVVAFFQNTVHLSIVEANGDMQMRFALWAIIMQIGKKCFLCQAPFGRVFLIRKGKMFGFSGVEYKIQPSKYFF